MAILVRFKMIFTAEIGTLYFLFPLCYNMLNCDKLTAVWKEIAVMQVRGRIDVIDRAVSSGRPGEGRSPREGLSRYVASTGCSPTALDLPESRLKGQYHHVFHIDRRRAGKGNQGGYHGVSFF